jgi:glutamyl-tRNA synthetase/glutamyl-Q tRNA(Asp) synthetase
MPHPLTRFAPSPTGFLHLGHVVNAIHVWGLAGARGGRVLLRIEDHDRTRCRPEYETALLEDLEWLGFEPDTGSAAGFRAGASLYRQSDNDAEYQEAVRTLSERGLVYVCGCSRKDIARKVPDLFNEEMRYPGTCRDLGLAPAPGFGLRVRLEPSEECFDDERLGPQRQVPSEQCGDLLIRDRLGQWTYQFAVTVDDLRHGVDLVVRGEDLLSSTGRQIQLARLLGRPTPPRFYHHALIRHPSGEKLSKAARDTGIRELRAAGVSAQEVLGEAAWRSGLLKRSRPLRVSDLPELFD